MPVERFRDPEDARRALWSEKGDPSLPGRIRRLWRRSSALAPPIIPRGVQRFRSIEDAAREREQRTAERVSRLRAARVDRD